MGEKQIKQRCSICGELKELSEFHARGEGLDPRCKDCKQKRRKELKEGAHPPISPHHSGLMDRVKKIRSDRRDVDKFASVQKQMSMSAPSGHYNIRCVWRRFLNYLDEGNGKFKGFNPNQLLKFQENAKDKEKYELFDEIQKFINLLSLRWNTKKGYGQILLGFFAKNRESFPRDAKLRVKAKEFNVISTLTSEEVRLAALASKSMYRAIVLCRFQSSMDWGCFDYWNKHGWEDIQKQLKTDPDIIRIEIPGRSKTERPRKFHTYLGTDAIKALRDYIPHRKNVTGDQYIFYTMFRYPISKQGLNRYWLRTLRRIGLLGDAKKHPNGVTPYGISDDYTGKGLHEMRDIFRTLWRKSGVDVAIAEFMMGHAIDPLQYDKACDDKDWTAAHYRKVLPWLNIISELNPEAAMKIRLEVQSEQEIKIEELKRALEEQSIRIEQLEKGE